MPRRCGELYIYVWGVGAKFSTIYVRGVWANFSNKAAKNNPIQ